MKRVDSMVLLALSWVLVTMLGLGPGPRIDLAARWASPSKSSKPVIHPALPSFGSPTSSSLDSLPRRSPWRHRIKTVLEDTDARGLQPVDLGPSVMPETQSLSALSKPGVARSRALIPLRC
jgi:hypothetical protein